MSDELYAVLTECMKKEFSSNMSGYIQRLIVEKNADLTKRGPGRPKTKEDDPEEEEKRDIPNPDKRDAVYNPFLTRSEYEAQRAMWPNSNLYPPLD